MDLVVVSSPFQFFAALQFVRARSAGQFQLVTIESPAATVDWTALIRWAGVPVQRCARGSPPAGARGRALAMWSQLDAFRAAGVVARLWGDGHRRLCIGSYADRVQRSLRWLLKVAPQDVVVLDDGLDSVGLEARIRHDIGRSPWALPIGPGVTVYSAVLRTLDPALGTIEHHHFDLLSFTSEPKHGAWFVGQPLISDGILSSDSYTRLLTQACSDGATNYLAHPRDRAAEKRAAAAAGLQVDEAHLPAELALTGAEQIFGVYSTALFSAKCLGLSPRVVAYRPARHLWKGRIQVDLVDIAYSIFSDIGMIVVNFN